MLIGFLAAALSALLSSVATLVQARGARELGRRGAAWYSAGLSLDLLGWAMSAFALRYLPVFAVQAVVATQVAFTVVGGQLLGTVRAGRTRLLAAGASVAGLGVVAASGSTGTTAVDTDTVDLVLLVLLAVLLIAIPRARSAAGRAVIAGLAFGGVAVAVRSLHQRTGEWTELLTQPPTYAVPVFAGLGAVMLALALRRGEPDVVAAIVVGVEMLAAGALGIALLGDGIRAGWQLPCAFAVLVALAGLTALARAPDRRD
jgi:drug/metabolite transporter (DMT)-like permease